MASALNGEREFVVHHGGSWVGNISNGKYGLADYAGGSEEIILLDGDELCWFDHRKEVLKILGVKDGDFHVMVLIDGSPLDIKTDQDLMSMWKTVKREGDGYYHMWVGLGVSPITTLIDDHVILINSPPTSAVITSIDLDSPICIHPPPRADRASNKPNIDSSKSLASRRSLFGGDKTAEEIHTAAANIIEDWAIVIDSGALFEDNAMFEDNGDLNQPDEEDSDVDGDLSIGLVVDGGKEMGSCAETHVEQLSLELQLSDSDNDEDFEPPSEEEDEVYELLVAESDWMVNEDAVNVEEEDVNDNVGGEIEFPPNIYEGQMNEDTMQWVKDSRNIFQEDEDEMEPVIDTKAELMKGQTWRTMQECRMFFKRYAIENHFSYRQQKNCSKRFELRCLDPSCTWLMKASKKAHDHTVVLRTIEGVHLCQADKDNKYAQAKAPWVVQELDETVRAHPDYTPKDIAREIFRRFGAEISYSTAWAAKVKLLERINGNYEHSYRMAHELVQQVLKVNPQSTVYVHRDDQNQFEGFFLAFRASLDGFVQGCRPVVGLDGCFLKGKYGGATLCAMGLDGMNGLFPLAIFICKGENGITWHTFLGILQRSLTKHKEMLTFISDRQKGLINAVTDLFPGSNHRYCFRHMYKNFVNKFPGGHLMKLSWDAARFFKKPEHEKTMAQLQKDAPLAYAWLEKVPKKCWARSHFDNTTSCDSMTNNFCESFNSWILKMRDKPLIPFIDKYTMALMSLFYDRKMLSKDMPEGGLNPQAMKVIKKHETKYHKFTIEGVPSPGDNAFCAIHMKSQKKYIVDLGKNTCTCLVWQMTGLPCVHAVAVIRPRREDWSMYYSEYYSVESFRKTYGGYIYPLQNEEDWDLVPPEYEIKPPPTKNGPGRPKKCRIRGNDEDENPTKKKRQCRRCFQVGHNKTSCARRNPTFVPPSTTTNIQGASSSGTKKGKKKQSTKTASTKSKVTFQSQLSARAQSSGIPIGKEKSVRGTKEKFGRGGFSTQ